MRGGGRGRIRKRFFPGVFCPFFNLKVAFFGVLRCSICLFSQGAVSDGQVRAG